MLDLMMMMMKYMDDYYYILYIFVNLYLRMTVKSYI